MTVQTFTPTELATVPGAVPDGVAAIVAWANTANAAGQLAERLIDTPFIPTSFWPLPRGVTDRSLPQGMSRRDQLPNESLEQWGQRRQMALSSATAAVLFGGEIGFTPLMAWASVYVVPGQRPSLYAEAMEALVRSKGHDIEVLEQTATRCVVRGRRKGEVEWQRPVTFDMERARKAGYVARNPKYNDDPITMLHKRAISIQCRQLAPEALRGIASAEEVQDETEAIAQSASSNGTRTVQRAPRKAVEAAPAPTPMQRPEPVARVVTGPPLPGEEETPPPAPDAVTQAQLTKLGTVFTSLGVKGDGSRAERLRISSSIVGRELTTSKDLTKDEARTLIDTLEGANPEQLAELLVPAPAASEQPPADVTADLEDKHGIWDAAIEGAELDLDTDDGDEPL